METNQEYKKEHVSMQSHMASDTNAHHQQPSQMEKIHGKAHILAGKVMKEVGTLELSMEMKKG